MLRIHLYQVDSTNSYVKELLKEGEELADFTVVDADFQTRGRGQQGNSWESERGENITFSLVCHPTFLKAADQFILSQAIALAVQRTLSSIINSANDHDDKECVTVKWPNDIYWKDKKISGTLIECNLKGDEVSDCIVGTGVNINQTQFHSDAPNPVSLAQIVKHTINKDEVLENIVNNFQELYGIIREGRYKAITTEYMNKLYRRNGFHWYREPNATPFEAEIVSVEPSGHLVLRRKDGTTVSYEFKEVQFLMNNE